jgi:hypothetical protein
LAYKDKVQERYYRAKWMRENYSHRPYVKTAKRSWNLKKNYGITQEEYNALLENQNELCAICKSLPIDLNLNVDHNHNTGQVRGLLCEKCNKGIGLFLENPETLRLAAIYLEYFSDKI